MVAWLLRRALEALEELPPHYRKELVDELAIRDEEWDRWRDLSQKLTVVFHADGVLSQFEGYEQLREFDWEGYRERYGNIQRLDRVLEAEGDSTNRYKVSKQADVLMLLFLLSRQELRELLAGLGYEVSDDQLNSTVEYYLERTSHGSTLSAVVSAWSWRATTRMRRGCSCSGRWTATWPTFRAEQPRRASIWARWPERWTSCCGAWPASGRSGRCCGSIRSCRRRSNS